MRTGLYVTCLTDTMFPETGKGGMTLLQRLGRRLWALPTLAELPPVSRKPSLR